MFDRRVDLAIQMIDFPKILIVDDQKLAMTDVTHFISFQIRLLNSYRQRNFNEKKERQSGYSKIIQDRVLLLFLWSRSSVRRHAPG